MAVLTNKPHVLAGPLLKQLDLLRFFPIVYGAGSRGYVKPDPRIFHDAVVRAEEIVSGGKGHGGRGVMIGDSVTDLQTARAAGVPCILMSYGYTPVPAASLGADTVLDHFAAQLPDAIARLPF